MVMKEIAIIGIVIIALSVTSGAMPMQVCTPEEIANILLAPTINDIEQHKSKLVEGEITFDEWKEYMRATKRDLDIKLVILRAIRDSGRAYNEKLELLNAVFPWRIR